VHTANISSPTRSGRITTAMTSRRLCNPINSVSGVLAVFVSKLRDFWDDLSPLAHRVIAAAVLVPLALSMICIGNFFFTFIIVAGAIISYREWLALVQKPGWPKSLEYTAYASVAGAILLCDFVNVNMAFLLLVLGGIAVAVIAHLYIDKGDRRAPPWLCFGVFYIGLAGVCLLWLRQEGEHLAVNYNWSAVLMLFCQVWATDSCAYFAGRKFGGPKLAPGISPNKTWSGLIGGIAGSVLTMVVFAALVDARGHLLAYAIIGAVLAIVAQAGDLFESYVKRRAGVKDSGTLIPGHGGILDRIDGLLAAAPVFALAFHWLT
jgi:phosphatidate cytidylyltransferase